MKKRKEIGKKKKNNLKRITKNWYTEEEKFLPTFLEEEEKLKNLTFEIKIVKNIY